jgi:ABC-type ATPase involved in cell division
MIEMDDVRLDHPRGGPAIVTGATLAVPAGEVVVIVGAAGVGTSRLVAAALGEHAATAGKLTVLGHDVGKLRRSSLRLLRRRVGIVPQDLCLLDDRSVQLNVMMPLEIDGIPRAISVVRAAECLARVGLEADAQTPVHELPPSARQRVAVARALVRGPEVVLADHPTSLQDAAGAELVLAAIGTAAHAGAACLVFGRDPALRTIAEREGWRQLALIDGVLRPLGEVPLDGRSIDELLVDLVSAPTPAPLPLRLPSFDDLGDDNVIPFPAAAGVA